MLNIYELGDWHQCCNFELLNELFSELSYVHAGYLGCDGDSEGMTKYLKNSQCTSETIRQHYYSISLYVTFHQRNGAVFFFKDNQIKLVQE